MFYRCLIRAVFGITVTNKLLTKLFLWVFFIQILLQHDIFHKSKFELAFRAGRIVGLSANVCTYSGSKSTFRNRPKTGRIYLKAFLWPINCPTVVAPPLFLLAILSDVHRIAARFSFCSWRLTSRARFWREHSLSFYFFWIVISFGFGLLLFWCCSWPWIYENWSSCCWYQLRSSFICLLYFIINARGKTS